MTYKEQFAAMVHKPLLLEFHIEEWNMPVYLRKWSIGELLEIADKARSHSGDNAVSAEEHSSDYAFVCARSLCDPEGNRLFKDDDLSTLRNQVPARIINRISNQAWEWNEFDKAKVDDAKKN